MLPEQSQVRIESAVDTRHCVPRETVHRNFFDDRLSQQCLIYTAVRRQPDSTGMHNVHQLAQTGEPRRHGRTEASDLRAGLVNDFCTSIQRW